MSNHQPVSNNSFSVKLLTSDFIDCPAGDLNVIVKNISTNNSSLFCEHNYIRVEMLSKVDKINIQYESLRKDLCQSLPLVNYHHKICKEDPNFNIVLMDHVSNLISRHYEDKISIKILHGKVCSHSKFISEREDKIVAHTEIPLN